LLEGVGYRVCSSKANLQGRLDAISFGMLGSVQ